MDADEAIAGLMATLLPGSAGFPAARDTGMTGLLAERLRRADPDLPAQVLAALTRGRAAPSTEEAWTDSAARMEAVDPKLFAEFRKYSYLTYYEQPAVIAAIRAMGFRYNDAPLPEGYPDEPFEPTRDQPQRPHGRWRRTEEVARVDLGGLDLESLR